MPKLHLGEAYGLQQYGEVLLETFRGLRTICGVRYVRRYSMLLVTLSVRQISGTVVPHCDFQKVLPRIGLYKGGFLYVRSRNAQTRAPPCTLGNTFMVPTQLIVYYSMELWQRLDPLAASTLFGSFT